MPSFNVMRRYKVAFSARRVSSGISPKAPTLINDSVPVMGRLHSKTQKSGASIISCITIMEF